MPRYVFNYKGSGQAPPEDVEKVSKMGKIVDRDVRTLLVESNTLDAAEVTQHLPQWGVEPERFYPVPDTKKKISKPA